MVLDLATLPILIVDDNKHARRMMFTIFQAAGASDIRVVDGPADAYDLLKIWNPGIIITDFLMHPISGFQFATELRANPEHRCTQKPIVLITADEPNHEFVQKVKAAGVDALVRKPIAPAGLFTRMEWALNHARKRSEDTVRQARAAVPAQRRGGYSNQAAAVEAESWTID